MSTTWNPSDKNSNITLSDLNLTAESATASYVGVRSTTSKNWGKLYAEFLVVTGTSSAGPEVGLATSSASLSGYIGSNTQSWGYFFGKGDTTSKKQYGGGISAYGYGYGADGDLLMMAVDLDNSMIWWGKNGAWGASGDPATRANPAFSNVTLTPLYVITTVRTAKITANFGASAFTYTMPSGFSAWDSVIGEPMTCTDYRHVKSNVSLHNRYFL